METYEGSIYSRTDVGAREAELNKFGNMLWETRLMRGEPREPLAMRKAARLCGDVAEQTYASWEKGKSRPDISNKPELLEALSKFTGRGKIEILAALDLIEPIWIEIEKERQEEKLGGRDSNPQPIDYEVTKRHLESVK